jgi:hypothetical protein
MLLSQPARKVAIAKQGLRLVSADVDIKLNEPEEAADVRIIRVDKPTPQPYLKASVAGHGPT